jgi:hypothetical protein
MVRDGAGEKFGRSNSNFTPTNDAVAAVAAGVAVLRGTRLGTCHVCAADSKESVRSIRRKTRTRLHGPRYFLSRIFLSRLPTQDAHRFTVIKRRFQSPRRIGRTRKDPNGDEACPVEKVPA